MYYQVYIENVDMFRTKYLELGKKMADALEAGYAEDGDPMIELIVVFMPKFKHREFEIRIDFEGIPLVGKMDGFDDDVLDIDEAKSGKKWTQSMVDQHGQLTFYALLVWLKYGKLPRKIKLHWARTDEDMEGRLKLTGDIRTFETKRSLKDIILFSKRIKTAWAEICELGKFAKQNEVV